MEIGKLFWFYPLAPITISELCCLFENLRQNVHTQYSLTSTHLYLYSLSTSSLPLSERNFHSLLRINNSISPGDSRER